jgi:hypothetical protein
MSRGRHGAEDSGRNHADEETWLAILKSTSPQILLCLQLTLVISHSSLAKVLLVLGAIDDSKLYDSVNKMNNQEKREELEQICLDLSLKRNFF